MADGLAHALWPLTVPYGGAVRLRNWLFDVGLRRVERLPVRVVAVGNLTVGGTGKTPLVMWLVEAARRAGWVPGVLARGYGRAPGAELNDEGAMLAARDPDLAQVQDPDRVRGGRQLLARGVDLVILDDGFQHRRLHRDRDLVCLDAGAPLGNGMLLPAGRLREAPRALRRADGVVLTRADGLGADALAQRRQQVRAWAGRALPVWSAAHAPRDLVAMPSGEVLPVAGLAGQRTALVSAIARPATFEATVRGLGAEVAWSVRRRDHHRFGRAELAAIWGRARVAGLPVLVTEKDAPKLVGAGLDYLVLRVDLRFLGGDPTAADLGLQREVASPAPGRNDGGRG